MRVASADWGGMPRIPTRTNWTKSPSTEISAILRLARLYRKFQIVTIFEAMLRIFDRFHSTQNRKALRQLSSVAFNRAPFHTRPLRYVRRSTESFPDIWALSTVLGQMSRASSKAGNSNSSFIGLLNHMTESPCHARYIYFIDLMLGLEKPLSMIMNLKYWHVPRTKSLYRFSSLL